MQPQERDNLISYLQGTLSQIIRCRSEIVEIIKMELGESRLEKVFPLILESFDPITTSINRKVDRVRSER